MNATTQTLSSHLQREGGQFTEGIILCIIICKWDGHQFVGHCLIPYDLWDEINIMHNSFITIYRSSLQQSLYENCNKLTLTNINI